jgi:4a-hydroxytetrahydrobiopterin dehydratase
MKLSEQQCGPCAGGIPPMEKPAVESRLKNLAGWFLTEQDRRIERRFKFSDFVQALAFVNRIGSIAEEQGHHPDICFGYGYCHVTFQTHAIGGLAENDFIMAAKVSDLM